MAVRKLPDLWNNCYTGEHRSKLSPEQFREEWCNKCLNAGCRNSRGAESEWMKRMLVQEDVLLHNPRFADPNDPQFARIRDLDFKDMIHQALAIEVSSKKGDWTVPTEAEISTEAARMVGMLPPEAPTGFQAPEEPETPPEEPEDGEPQPPERLVDEVQEYDLGAEEDPLTEEARNAEVALEHALKFLGDNLPEEGVEVEVDETVLPSNPPKGQWKVRGDSGSVYEVTLNFDGSWECSCPSRENPCKHARDIGVKLSRMPSEPPSNPTQPQAPPASAPAAPRPHSLNTSQSVQGQMIGGATAPKAKPEPDPWAVPETKPKERVIPVGGRVTFGGGKTKG